MKLEKLLAKNISLKKNFLLSSFLSLSILGNSFFLEGCKEETIVKESSEPNDESKYRYLQFEVICGTGSSSRGEVIGVSVYDQLTKNEIIFGITSSEGKFTSPNKLNASKKYRIELYSLPEKKCVSWINDISLNTLPTFWSDNFNNEIEKIYLRSSCGNYDTLNNCWGPR